MKRFIEFLEELENEDQGTVLNEEGAGAAGGGAPSPSVGGDVAPSVPHTDSGAPGGILAPGSDSVVPAVINGNAPAHGCHGHHHHGHRPPPPPPWRRFYGRVYFVSGLGTVRKIKKRKSKKSKKSKNNSKRKPKNPY